MPDLNWILPDVREQIHLKRMKDLLSSSRKRVSLDYWCKPYSVRAIIHRHEIVSVIYKRPYDPGYLDIGEYSFDEVLDEQFSLSPL